MEVWKNAVLSRAKLDWPPAIFVGNLKTIWQQHAYVWNCWLICLIKKLPCTWLGWQMFGNMMTPHSYWWCNHLHMIKELEGEVATFSPEFAIGSSLTEVLITVQTLTCERWLLTFYHGKSPFRELRKQWFTSSYHQQANPWKMGTL